MKLKHIILLIFSDFLVAVGISIFQLPNKIVTGGVGGLATILFHIVDIPPGLTIVLINIVLLAISYRTLGKEFIIKTLFSATMLSLFVQLLSLIPPATSNIIFAAIFGGAVYGLGIGITFVIGSTTGGTDIVARLLQIKFPQLSVGKTLMIVDGTVIFLSLLAFGEIDLAMAGIICLTISTFTVDWLIKKLNYSKMIFVISINAESISKEFTSISTRGATLVDVRGGYTFEQKSMVICLLKDSEINVFKQVVHNIDPYAFMVISSAEQIIGNGFRMYK